MWSSQYGNGNYSPESPEPNEAPDEHQSKHILVVDDEPVIRALLSRVLSRVGYIVDVANEGSSAWDLISQRRYDAIIVDLKMPGINGEVLYRRIHEVDQLQASRVIFVTGDTVGHESRNFVADTGNALVEKPFDLLELQRLLQSMLGK